MTEPLTFLGKLPQIRKRKEKIWPQRLLVGSELQGCSQYHFFAPLFEPSSHPSSPSWRHHGVGEGNGSPLLQGWEQHMTHASSPTPPPPLASSQLPVQPHRGLWEWVWICPQGQVLTECTRAREACWLGLLVLL